jgi:cell division protein FtsI/penicillin-binding protein 2
MEAAVQFGTATDAQLEGIRVAGKTGTAEFFCPNDELRRGLCHQGQPLPTHAWFTTFAPVENPEIALVVYVYNGGEGSETAAPIARDILQWYFQRKADVASQFLTPVEQPSPTDAGQSTP